MSSELERRLEGLLAAALEPEPGAGEEALHRALRGLAPPGPAHRGLRTGVVVLAATALLLAVAAGSLAAAGAIHVSFGAKSVGRQTTAGLALPRDANGVAAIVDGRLSVVTRGGFRLQGLPVSAAALSPHALYVAAGVGDSLVAMAPDGRRAWSHPAGGEVVAIAWAPDGFRIAYVVRSGRRLALHVIWGNGTDDTVIDRSVRGVEPSWRADSLALAYVGAGGRAVVYDLAHRSRKVLGAAAPVLRLAFAPVGRTLAVATPGSVVLGGRTVATGRVEALGWLHGSLAVALEERAGPPLVRTFSPTGRSLGSARSSGRVLAVTSGFVVVAGVHEIVAGRTRLLGLAPGQTVADVEIG